jgi:hypothetical protein
LQVSDDPNDSKIEGTCQIIVRQIKQLGRDQPVFAILAQEHDTLLSRWASLKVHTIPEGHIEVVHHGYIFQAIGDSQIKRDIGNQDP